jgi:hypothetical protein
MNVEVIRLCITSFGMVGIYSSLDSNKLLFKMNAIIKSASIVVMFLACCGLLKVVCHDLFE